MKKNYFMLAFASLMLAACASNDLLEDVVKEEVPQPIGFETFANKQTRAENSNADYVANNLSSHHETFNVWASKELESGTYVDVYAKTNPGTVNWATRTGWTANTLKYWDKAAVNYYFYAAAPSEPSWEYTNATDDNGSTGYLTLANYTLEGTANDNLATGSNTTLTDSWEETTGNDLDLMIAAPCSVAKSNYNKATPDKVNLDFIHILSRLNIAVKATDNNIVVNALEVHRLKNKGSFDENASLSNGEGKTPDVLASGTIKRWGTTSSVDIDTDVAYTLVGNLGSTGLSLTKDAAAVYTHEYLIMPQVQTKTEECVGTGSAPSNDAYIYLEYTVNGETYKTFYGLAQAFGVTTLAFNEGWQNTLTLTISPATIEFTADAAAWATGTTYPID